MTRAALVVDDSATMQEMVGLTLGKAGFVVTRAANGREALGHLTARPFDLIVTDLNMPQMDGVELIKRLRVMPGFKFTPVLMLTTDGSDEKKQQGRAAGATGWLTKPFDPDKLLSIVKKVLP